MNLHITYRNYITHQHPLANDYEGKVVTTVIESRKNDDSFKKTMLYIHGFSDYFFHSHLMDYCGEIGVNFYAIDLRKSGRSLLPHQHPHYCKSLREYFEDLDYACQFIEKQLVNTELYFIGHQLGGLLALYYTKYGVFRGRIKGVIVNSPLLELNLAPMRNVYFNVFLKGKVRDNPFETLREERCVYTTSIHKDFEGEWSFDLSLKPTTPYPMYYTVVSAIKKAQEAIVEDPLSKDLPILVLSSDSSSSGKQWTAMSMKSDVVLNVNKLERMSRRIGGAVEYCKISNAIHDVFLSPSQVRQKALVALKNFLEEN